MSDRDWVLDGANVHVSMIGFDNGSEADRKLDANPVGTINANLTSTTEVGRAVELQANALIGFIGVAQKAPFDVSAVQVWTGYPRATHTENQTLMCSSQSAMRQM